MNKNLNLLKASGVENIAAVFEVCKKLYVANKTGRLVVSFE